MTRWLLAAALLVISTVAVAQDDPGTGGYRWVPDDGPIGTPPPHECGKGPVTVTIRLDIPCKEPTAAPLIYNPATGTYTDPNLGRPKTCVKRWRRFEKWSDWPECGGQWQSSAP